MMERFTITTFRAVLVFCMSGELLSSAAKAAVPAFCTTTVHQKPDVIPQPVLPSYIDAVDFLEPAVNTSTLDLTLELCPNNTTLKVSWKLNETLAAITKLCYRISSPDVGEVLYRKCVKLNLKNLNRNTAVTCWFPMQYYAYRPIISAVVGPVEHGGKYVFFGQFNTSSLDSKNRCRDICEVTTMEASNRLISCHATSSIYFDDRVTIKAVWFDSIDSPTCKESPVFISGRTSNQLDYSLNCTHQGPGIIKVLYNIDNRVCLKNHILMVVCDIASQATLVSSTAAPGTEAEGFQTFVIFGVVCMIIITAIVVIINFATQKLRQVFKGRRRCIGRNHVNLNGSEGMPLHVNNFQQEGNVPPPVIVNPVKPVDKVIKRQYLKRVDSMSSDGQASMTSSIRGQNVRKLHRCMTVALLENTESFYRKKILFLPTPFDTFSRDATNLLKAVFTLELNIPTQCCFDRDIYQQYMTSNRYKWIESHLGDYDRIFIFLCFTTICGEARGNSMVDDVLDHLLLNRIRPHCKVAFLHLTDSSENLEKNHHGDSIHLSDKESYADFVSEVLKYCGKNMLSEQDLVCRLTNCETSKHFLRFIGVKNV